MEIYIKFAFSMKPQKDKFLAGFDWQYSFLKYLINTMVFYVDFPNPFCILWLLSND